MKANSNPRLSPSWRLLSAGILVLAAALLTLFSPLLLTYFADRPLNWGQLSDVGQTYGAASALLSGLALIGVAGSFVVQRRQAHASQRYSVRQRHFDLARLAMDDTGLLHAIEPSFSKHPDARGIIYVNLWVNYWWMCWDLREMDEPAVRHVVSKLFAGSVGRSWWEMNSADWKATTTGARFATILDQEHRRAISSGPPYPNSQTNSPTVKPQHPIRAQSIASDRYMRSLFLMAVGGTIGAIAGYRYRRS